MFKNNLITYYRDRLKSIHTHFEGAVEKNDHDDVHDLRVDIKRMRSFFNLIGTVNADFAVKKSFKPFRRIATMTGGLRDTQVQQELESSVLDALNITFEPYENYLKSRKMKFLDEFRTFSQEKPLKTLSPIRKKIKSAFHNIDPVNAAIMVQGRFYNLRSNMVMLSREEDLKDEILHDIRKRSKDLHYTLEIISQCFNLFRGCDEFIANIKRVHQALGKWHDYDVGLRLLSTFRRDYDGKIPEDEYNRIRRYMRNEHSKLKHTFHTVLEEFAETAMTI